jgi:hypothetical protein
MKSALSGLFTVSAFYKDITQVWTQSIQSEDTINIDEIEEIMKIAEEFTNSPEYSTNSVEACIIKNEDFFDQQNYDLKINTLDNEGKPIPNPTHTFINFPIFPS